MTIKVSVGFSRRHKRNPLNWLISLVERTEASHVFIKIYSKSLDRNLIYHADLRGVFFIGEESFIKNNKILKEYDISSSIDEQFRIKMLQFTIDESGKRYNTLQLLGILYIRIMKVFGFKVLNPFRNNAKSYICTELVIRMLVELGHSYPDDLESVGIKCLEDYLESLINQ
jgi:hypothetical protein